MNDRAGVVARESVLRRYRHDYGRHLDQIDRGPNSEQHRLAAWLLQRAAEAERDDPAPVERERRT